MTAGHCLCGAVRITVEGLSDEMSACHCGMCARWSGGVQFCIEAPTATTRIDGPVKVYRSSPIAERGWCDTCGSALFIRDVGEHDRGIIELCPGLFDGFAGATLVSEIYVDRAPFRLAGDHERVPQARYEAENPHLNQEARHDQV